MWSFSFQALPGLNSQQGNLWVYSMDLWGWAGGGGENTGPNSPRACWLPGFRPFHIVWGLGHAFLTALYESLAYQKVFLSFAENVFPRLLCASSIVLYP